MTRNVRDARLEKRADRQKLAISLKPYWVKAGPEIHLGYRKGKNARTWLLRRYLRDSAKPYQVEAIGDADDQVEADGESVLTYFQAQDRARQRARELAEFARVESLGPPVTVRTAIEGYIAAREKRETAIRVSANTPDGAIRGMKRDARSRLTKHVLGVKIADKPLATLTVDDLTKWRDRLALPSSSVQRLVNDLKAALNAAARRARDQLPPTVRETIKDGLATTRAAPSPVREMQVLPDADVRALIAAAWDVDEADGWDGDLARLVLVLAATGARFSQAIRMTVADVQATRLMVPVSRKGRGQKSMTHVAVRVGDDVSGALAKATCGRKGGEPLFLRPRYEQVGVAKWEKQRERVAWYAAAELARPWRAILFRANLSATIVPYSLRHSSIVRGLRAGLPVRLVAALHDTSSSMVEVHYAAHVIDALDELAALAVVPLTTASATVTELRSLKGRSR